MKKITLLFVALLFSFGCFAQFHVTSNFGDIEDGDVLTFHTIDMDDASVVYEVHNDSDEPIFMRIKVLSIQNADGSSVEICFGNCYYSISEGFTAPVSNPYPSIDPGETQPSTGDHFWNANDEPINPDEPIIYVLQFQQINGAGTQVYSTLTWTYKYVPDLAVDAQSKEFDVKILGTLINNGQLNIKTQKPVDIQIYNLLGKEVKTAELKNGLNKLNVSNLSSQIYLVRFHNAQGQTKTQKIVIE